MVKSKPREKRFNLGVKVFTSFRNGEILKTHSCKLYKKKYMFVSTQITNTEIFVFMAVLVFKLLSRKPLFRNRKDNRNCYKVGYFLRK